MKSPFIQRVSLPVSSHGLIVLDVTPKQCPTYHCQVISDEIGYAIEVTARGVSAPGAMYWCASLRYLPHVGISKDTREKYLEFMLNELWVQKSPCTTPQGKNGAGVALQLDGITAATSAFYSVHDFPAQSITHISTEKDAIIKIVADAIILDSFWRVR